APRGGGRARGPGRGRGSRAPARRPRARRGRAAPMTAALALGRRRGWRRFRLSAALVVPGPIDDVFAFFADAGHLEAITPPWLRFRVLRVAPPAVRRGTLIDYALRLHGLPLRWRSEISAWEPPHRFVDEQRRGPYRRWHHEHTFRAVAGGTEVRD